ncbi:hypothetical protein G4228_017599 [Cervus hanglu yarkandensis]|nr:hypothetical protein G4228_017599 [Cervus hanglu yarkandensis]
MNTRTRLQGSGFGAPAASRPTQDPPAWRGELGPPQAPRRDLEATPESPSRESTERARPRFTGAYTLIAPNEKRRNEMQQMAAKELEELERWKKQQSVKSINLPPMTLGGSQSEAEVRRRQQLQLIQSKYQKKGELLEFKRQQQEEERAKSHQAEHRRVNNAFLDRLQGESQPGGLQHFGGYWNMNSGNSWVSFIIFFLKN